MILNRENVEVLFTSFNGAYRAGLSTQKAKSQWMRVAMETRSGSSQEVYAWIGDIPLLREWVGERVVRAMSQHDFTVKNKDFELTIAVPRNDIEDDTYGVYGLRFQAMGTAAMSHYDLEVFSLLKKSFETVCYDGQYLVDSDHPVIGEDGAAMSVSNTGGGNGTPWFLIDSSSMFKPLVLQKRKEADNIVRRDMDDDEPVWNRNEIEYGIHCRDNVGAAFWQTIYGSKQPLTAENYNLARETMMAFKGDHGRALGIMPDLLVVPPTLDGEGRAILKSELVNGGESNIWHNSADLLVSPWLA